MFAVPKFKGDNNADDACRQLITKPTKMKKKRKNKTAAGKVTKEAKVKNDMSIKEDLLKDEIRAILSGDDTNLKLLPKMKKKSKKVQAKTETQSEIKKKPNIIGKVEKNPEKAPNYKQKKRQKVKEKMQQILNFPSESAVKKTKKILTLRERMMQQLQSARFRYINEEIYSTDSKQAQKMFTEDPDAFKAYHEGYRQQVNKWPLNPVDVIIKSIQKMPKTHIIADFGCGEAKIGKSVQQKVHSFDLVAMEDMVTACDMAHVPLENNTVDVVVFCLSLMGTNLHEYLLEANRVLKIGGILKIAEVESRFQDVNEFIESVKRFNLKNVWKDLSHNLFYFLDFKKETNIKNKKKLPTISLNPCLYKKR